MMDIDQIEEQLSSILMDETQEGSNRLRAAELLVVVSGECGAITRADSGYPTVEAYGAACAALRKHRERADQSEARERALAAHVERQAHVIFDTLAAIEDGEPDAIPYDEARALYNDAPTTSLNRLKAQWQVDALEDAQASLMLRGDDYEALRLMIETTRRQAEKAENLERCRAAQRAEDAAVQEMRRVASEGLSKLDDATARDIYRAIREGRVSIPAAELRRQAKGDAS